MGYPLNAITQTIYTIDLGNGVYSSTPIVINNRVPTYLECNLFSSPGVVYGEGDGTLENPWNFDFALEQLVSGDKLGVSSGVIIGEQKAASDNSKRFTPAFRTANSGTQENPIYIVAENFAALTNEGVTEIRSGATVSGDGWPAFGNLDRSYVYWVGFYTNENAENNKPRNDSAPVMCWSSHGGGFLYCNIVGSDVTWIDNHSGIRGEYSTNFIISDCKISNFKLNGSGSINQSGVITYGCRNVVIEYCEIDNCGNNIFWKATIPQYGLVARHNILSNAYDSMRLQQLEATEPNKIYQNLFLNYTNSAIWFSKTSVDLPLPQNTYICNNMFAYKTEASNHVGTFQYSKEGYDAQNKVFNNIIFDTNNSPVISSSQTQVEPILRYVAHNNNCYFDIGNFGGSESGNGTLRSLTYQVWQDTYNMDTEGLNINPLFVDAANYNFKLLEDSPCLDAGRDILNLKGNGELASINIGPYISISQSEHFGVRPLS